MRRAGYGRLDPVRSAPSLRHAISGRGRIWIWISVWSAKLRSVNLAPAGPEAFGFGSDPADTAISVLRRWTGPVLVAAAVHLLVAAILASPKYEQTRAAPASTEVFLSLSGARNAPVDGRPRATENAHATAEPAAPEDQSLAPGPAPTKAPAEPPIEPRPSLGALLEPVLEPVLERGSAPSPKEAQSHQASQTSSLATIAHRAPILQPPETALPAARSQRENPASEPQPDPALATGRSPPHPRSRPRRFVVRPAPVRPDAVAHSANAQPRAEPNPERVRPGGTPSPAVREHETPNPIRSTLAGAPTESGSTNLAAVSPKHSSSPSVPKKAHPKSEPYVGQLAVWLDKHKRYPSRARRRKQEGTVRLAFTIDRRGKVLEHAIVGSSGHQILDREVRAMLKRASPLPPIPGHFPEPKLSVVVPIAFSLR